MIAKMNIRKWISVGVLMLFCLGMGGVMLWKYGPSAITALGGSVPELARTESMSNIYGISAMGVFFCLLALFMFVRQLSMSIGKYVNRYLAEHPGVNMEQIDNDFNAAEQFGNVWIGRRWTFSYDIREALLENEQIVWVFSEADGGRRIQYYLCLGLMNGKIERIAVQENHLQMMGERYKKFPHMVVGNNPKYEDLFQNDMNAFLDIKYRQGME